MGQMASAVGLLESQSSGKIPSQKVVNPRKNASAIVLRNGKEVDIPVNETPTSLEQDKEKDMDITAKKSNTN